MLFPLPNLQAVPIIDENIDGEAYGMTLGDYISQMATVSPLDRPLSGVSGTMAVEDCIPPDDASLLSDYSDCSYVDPEEGFSDQDYIDPEYRGGTSSSSEFEDPEMPRSPWDHNSTDLFFSAAGTSYLCSLAGPTTDFPCVLYFFFCHRMSVLHPAASGVMP